jgi:hypothetical protein
MHEIDMDQYMIDAGFSADQLLHSAVEAIVDADDFPRSDSSQNTSEDFGRKAAWHVMGAVA